VRKIVLRAVAFDELGQHPVPGLRLGWKSSGVCSSK
jgi:hypothetical protein